MVAASAGVVAPAQVRVSVLPMVISGSAVFLVRLLQARVGVELGGELGEDELQEPAPPHCSPYPIKHHVDPFDNSFLYREHC